MKNLIRFCIIAIFAIFSVAAYAQEATEEVIEIELLNPEPEPGPSIFQLYQEGGVLYMSLITLCLVGILLAAWKQPSFVKELGSIALTLGFVSLMIGIRQACHSLLITADVSPVIIFAGIKVALVTPIWSCIVYIISLIIRIIQKPKTI